MSAQVLPHYPPISDEEITWAARLLKLQPNAFHGEDGTDPRQQILKSMDTIDVAACPGSGKTTLLVAKLAIIADKWQHRTRGICALSHTNVARSEIERRLSNTTAGRRLLSYPHYIGTIHAFVNEFLALPWLRRNGYPITMIDTGICEARRWRKLPFKTRGYLEKQNLDQSSFVITDTSFNVAKKAGKLKFGSDTETYKLLRKACTTAAKDGYHCYDDMFVWAHNAIEELPEIVNVIRSRFPLLFVDEAQDNSEEQSRILHRLFQAGVQPVTRQRFGDGNQAIFDSINSNEATTDSFPDEKIEKDLPTSHRFGQRIADFADPLGLIPCGLKGHGPQAKPLASGSLEGEHTVLVFDKGNSTKLLDAYCQLLLETFSDQELRDGVFTAVGQVHRPPLTSSVQKFPQHVGDYWAAYDPVLALRDPRPQTFVEYVLVGLGKAEADGETHLVVDKIAEGVLRLAAMTDSKPALPQRRFPHRHVLKLLDKSTLIQSHYRDLIVNIAEERQPLNEKIWHDHWQTVVKQIGETIAGGALNSSEANEFLKWKPVLQAPTSSPSAKVSRDNIYRYTKDNRQVKVRVGSIHSVKGETHTATLVVETFWYEHNLEALLPWLTGDKRGGIDEGARQQLRLRIHYVAMTRPTHLLCLAIDQSLVGKKIGNSHETVGQSLAQRGWTIKVI